MKLNIRGSKLEVTDAIRSYIESKIAKLDKYFENPDGLTANIVVKTRGIDQIAEVTIPIKRAVLRAEESNKDLYASIDFAVDKLERQIRKNKTRIKQKPNRESMDVFIDFEIEDDEVPTETIVKRKTIDMKPMSEEEAILQMNLVGHEFFVFKNADTNTDAVVYKRKDGNYGILEMK